ncbi:putative bifunctional diguanylate cyclase/phosphodiesterase [Caballeronia grimmiae]|uniref:putative bifunctional diguanylate cyclase/phosphodiesterase n=1 Tax=Caballeronia grimmiae TaxID=1071679 RepID=UPI0038BBDB1B
MRNQLFLSYFVSRFSAPALPSRFVRAGLPALIAAPSLAAWMAFHRRHEALAVSIAFLVFFAIAAVGRSVNAHRALKARASLLEQLARALLSTNRDCLKLIGPDGRMMHLSEVAAELMELDSRTQLVGADWIGFWGGEDRRAAQAAFASALRGNEADFEGYCPTAKGRQKWWRSTLYPIQDNNGRTAAILCPSRDISAETLAATAARRAEELLTDIEAHIPVVFWSTSADFQTLHHVSAGFETMWQLPVSALTLEPTAWQTRLPAHDLQNVKEAMRRMARDQTPVQYDFRLCRDDGSSRWIRANASPVKGETGHVERIVSVCMDVTDEKRRMDELDRLAHVDDLTGLANRHAFLKHLGHCAEAGKPFSLLLADIDRFKVFNDTVGTSAADSLLREIGEAFREMAPSGVFAARPSGDEFALVIPDGTTRSVTEIFADIGAAMSRLQAIGSGASSLTLSAGVARFPANGGTPEALMSNADAALYMAKQAGRNSLRAFGSEEARVIGSFQVERELRGAVSRAEFSLWYQPQFWTQSKEFAGVEALIRWNTPTQGIVSPGVFIPILEQCGLIQEVGDWIFARSVRQIAEWKESCGVDVLASINVSAKQLVDPALPTRFATMAGRHAVLPSQITLEITESALVEYAGRTTQVLRDLKSHGFRLALDDFGTGYSSLSYLTRLRPDVLKLDKSLVDDIDNDPISRTVVAGIVALAKALDIRIVAEGVERQTQLRCLEEMECDIIQGFLLGRPEPADSVHRRLARIAVPLTTE